MITFKDSIKLDDYSSDDSSENDYQLILFYFKRFKQLSLAILCVTPYDQKISEKREKYLIKLT